MANIELPKDAEGREIPLDTVALYDDSGNVHNIRRFMYTNDFDSSDKWINSWTMVVDDYKDAKPEQMHLTPPDSWEKLEDDLGRAAERDIVPTGCRYFNATNKCNGCPLYDSVNCDVHRDERAFENIIDRIRKLRGEDE